MGGKLELVHVLLFSDGLKKKIYTRVCEDDC